jgi:methionyl-tRNA formyltransferase
MKVLLLSPYPERIASTLQRAGDEVVTTSEPIDGNVLARHAIDYIVSYGYNHLVRGPVLDVIGERIINLHISYLPWNRGSDPNFWSFFDNTPKGVTIHRIDAGVDTGDILAQREVCFGPGETLASSYDRLRQEIETLFDEKWPAIRAGSIEPIPQVGSGSCHRRQDKEPIFQGLASGWQTPVAVVADLGARHRVQTLASESMDP